MTTIRDRTKQHQVDTLEESLNGMTDRLSDEVAEESSEASDYIGEAVDGGKLAAASNLMNALVGELDLRIIGAGNVTRRVIQALVAGQHVMLKSVPGLGKTSLVKKLARTIAVKFARIQFTSDLMPSDITGTKIYRPQSGKFEVEDGPVSDANLALGDEMNRASGKTKSGVLQLLEEGEITIDGRTTILPELFLWIATINPIDVRGHGTYPMEHAELDRFGAELSYWLPTDLETEREIWMTNEYGPRSRENGPIASVQQVLEARRVLQKMPIPVDVLDYGLRLVLATREHEAVMPIPDPDLDSELRAGGSPRNSKALTDFARGEAILQQRGAVSRDDMAACFPDTTIHRLVLDPEARMKGMTPRKVVAEILENTQ